MILESEEHAVRRGATVLALAPGGGATSDAYHLTSPDPSGTQAARAMGIALERSGVGAETVAYIAAHATSTKVGDIAETQAIRTAFGEHADRLAVSATKSLAGHLLGAAAALAAVTCVLAIRDGIVPPTINLDDPDPDCDLDYVPHTARRMPVRAAIANGFGFGGQNASVLFARV
jgi:3-oxoacyl-[acyl-carrier-protein] synthase II